MSLHSRDSTSPALGSWRVTGDNAFPCLPRGFISICPVWQLVQDHSHQLTSLPWATSPSLHWQPLDFPQKHLHQRPCLGAVTSHTVNTGSRLVITFTVRRGRTWGSSRPSLPLQASPGDRKKAPEPPQSHPACPRRQPDPPPPAGHALHSPWGGEGQSGVLFKKRGACCPSGSPRGCGVSCQGSSFQNSGCAICPWACGLLTHCPAWDTYSEPQGDGQGETTDWPQVQLKRLHSPDVDDGKRLLEWLLPWSLHPSCTAG